MTQHMGPSLNKNASARWAEAMIKHRWWVILVSVVTVLMVATGATKLTRLMDYRAFFSEDNPELTAFQVFQETYTKTDNLLFMVKPKNGDVFTKETLAIIEDMTEAAWQIPFASRVDSLTNFQYTIGLEDDLIVEDMFEDVKTWPASKLTSRKSAALAEPLLRDLLVTEDGSATGVNVLIRLPGKEITELKQTYSAAQALRAKVASNHPELDVHLSGIAALNNAFANDGPQAMAGLLPFMFLAIFVLAGVFQRSIPATGVLMVVVVLATMFAMGMAGFLGIGISPISASAPIVILTLAVADCIHIMTTFRSNLRNGVSRELALVDAIRTNIVAVSITSITTIIGFLSLNFSDAPPFRALGNISAIGIAAAWILSLTIFPALISFLKPKVESTNTKPRLIMAVADTIIRHKSKAAILGIAISASFLSLIPSLEVNDVFTEYFDDRIEFRRETDVMKDYFGPLAINYSIEGNGAGSVSNPEYLRMLDEFSIFLRDHPLVTHVFSFSDIMKRLNRNMNADDPRFNRIPDDRNLAAQYLLLYEISLPYGLDLNDRINVDKSASRVTVSFSSITTQQTKAFLAQVDEWFTQNAPNYSAQYASPQVMFTYIADRNLESMILGTAVAIAAISLVLMLALRSFSMGALSLIPNALPIAATFGAWAIISGEVGFSIAAVASISLGIVVDDTVHFLSKYNLAIKEKGYTAEQAVRHAFESVGEAIIINTVILVVGFSILATAAFKPTVDMGILTSLSLVFALVLDFLLLPPLLIWLGKRSSDSTHSTTGVQHAA